LPVKNINTWPRRQLSGHGAQVRRGQGIRDQSTNARWQLQWLREKNQG
jgi:hypothetical protein